MCLYGALSSPNEGDQACPRANGRGGSNLLSAVAAAALMLQISLQFESTSRGLQCCSQCTLCRSLSAAGAGAQRAEEQTLTLETRWTMPGTQPQVHNNKYLYFALQKQQSTSCLVSCAPNSATSIPTPNHSDIVCKLCPAKSK